ncbi:MAG: VWA domain-containing protein [Acidobacteriota bacterium]
MNPGTVRVAPARRCGVPAALAVTALALFTSVASAQPDPPQRLAISDVVQRETATPSLRLYLDVETDGGRFLDEIEMGSLTGTLGQDALQIGPSKPFTSSGEGVAFIFLVDVSASLSLERFDEIRAAIDSWISNLALNDRAAILAFGEQSELIVDLTRDIDALRAGLQSLSPTDRLTLLHRGLADALTLSQRQDEDLPSRRVIVLLSDGRDEGSGLALDDVLERLRDQPMPIYAIGHSQFGEPQRSRDLNVLRRLASNSGGAFFESEQTAFAESYAWISRAIDRVLIVDATCPKCAPDGRTYRLQLRLEKDGRVLTEGTEVRLLPMAAAAVADVAPAASAPAPEVESAPTEAPTPSSDGRLRLLPLLLGALALAAVIAVIARRRRPTAPVDGEIELTPPAVAPAAPTVGTAAPAAAAPAETPAEGALAGAGSRLRGKSMEAGRLAPTPDSLPEVKLRPRDEFDTDSVPLDPERPLRRRVVRLVVVRGQNKGREYRTVLHARAVVGTRSTCDCVLAGEENIGKEQFELVQRDDQVYVQNLDELRPTLINGLAMKKRELVNTGDLVGTQDTILRVMLDG